MGERKAVNKYYPPDWEPSMGGLDKYHGVHPLRERASKLHLGIMVIRFEMPFNIWCGGCNNHIGMGVRYNAEKKKIGMYYTTPIWQFRMKCHLCDNYIEMHTDPKNFDYLVVSGGRRKEEGYDQNDAECAAAHEPEERKRLGTDPMFKLQYQNKDETVLEEAEPIIDKLQESQEVWKDDYLLNRSLRKRHREDRTSDKLANSILKKTMGLDVKMAPTTKTDKITSSLVRFTKQKDGIKLKKKSEISSIFSDKRAALLTSLKQSGVKCSGVAQEGICGKVSLVKVDGNRRRGLSTESCLSSSSSSSSSRTSTVSSDAVPFSKKSRRQSEPSNCNGIVPGGCATGGCATDAEPSVQTSAVSDSKTIDLNVGETNSTAKINKTHDTLEIHKNDTEVSENNISLVSGYSSSESSDSLS